MMMIFVFDGSLALRKLTRNVLSLFFYRICKLRHQESLNQIFATRLRSFFSDLSFPPHLFGQSGTAPTIALKFTICYFNCRRGRPVRTTKALGNMKFIGGAT